MKLSIDVLVVEDEPVVRSAARRILQSDDLTVATAKDVDEACELLNRTPCRLVLSDLKLPGASGFDLLGSIRKRWPETEVVMITGYATLDNALATFQKGGFDFVAKPFDTGELLGVVRRALGFSKRASADALIPADGRNRAGTGEDGQTCFFLGRHSWARLDEDGSATIGVAETFPGLLGAIESLELFETEQLATQGKTLARLLGPGEIVHRIVSPLSGTVLTANALIQRTIGLIDRDPLGQGWLVRIIPNNLDTELALLDQRNFQQTGHRVIQE